MFTRRLFPGEERPGYELLGLLLLLQLVTQTYQSLITYESADSDPTASLIQSTLYSSPQDTSKIKPKPTGFKITEATAPVDSPPASTQNMVLDLADETILSWIPTGSRRCPLCLDPMKDPTAAACGHLFCWTCILRWTGQAVGQGECPICRSRCGREGLLRLSG
jgi:peroxin-10